MAIERRFGIKASAACMYSSFMMLQRLSRISCCSSTAVLRCAGLSGSNILEATSRRPKVITYVQNLVCGQYKLQINNVHQRREFSSIQKKSITATDTINDIKPVGVKFAALLTKHLGLSRRQAGKSSVLFDMNSSVWRSLLRGCFII